MCLYLEIKVYFKQITNIHTLKYSQAYMRIINILQQSVLKFQLKTMTLLGTLHVLKQKRLNLPQRVVKLIYEKGW